MLCLSIRVFFGICRMEVFRIAFGITRAELEAWKAAIDQGQIAYLTHYWRDARFPNSRTVTKVGCRDVNKLAAWCKAHHLNPKYIHVREKYPHFDLLGSYQYKVLQQLGLHDHIERFGLHK